MTAATLTAQQVTQLLAPINPSRILEDGKGHSHVSQQDVLAHLIRVFGFGNFDIDVQQIECVFEHNRPDRDGKPSTRWDVCYRALVRLTIRTSDGDELCHYENGSTATAQNQTLGDAHDLAYKSAISLSVKRAAIALGDQFGLSLYNRGQREALVRGTLIRPEADEQAKHEDVQEGVPQQVSLGNDETAYDDGTQPEPPAPAPQPAPQPEPTAEAEPEPDLADQNGSKHPDEDPVTAQALADTATRLRTITPLKSLYEQAKRAGLLATDVVDKKTGEQTPLVQHIARQRARIEKAEAPA